MNNHEKPMKNQEACGKAGENGEIENSLIYRGGLRQSQFGSHTTWGPGGKPHKS